MGKKNENKKIENLSQENFIIKMIEILDDKYNDLDDRYKDFIKAKNESKRNTTNLLMYILTILVMAVLVALSIFINKEDELQQKYDRNLATTIVVANTVKELDLIYDRLIRGSIHEAMELIDRLERDLSTEFNSSRRKSEKDVIKNLLISAHGLKGMTHYRICQKDTSFKTDKVIKAGKDIRDLDKDNWHGYRLIAMGTWRKNKGIINDDDILDSVIQNLSLALEENPAKNCSMDHMNLLELYFVNSRFEEAKATAIEIRDRVDKKKLTYEILAIESFNAMYDILFYILDGRDIIFKDIEDENSENRENLEKKQNNRWGTTFLHEFYNQIDSNDKIPNEKKPKCKERLEEVFYLSKKYYENE